MSPVEAVSTVAEAVVDSTVTVVVDRMAAVGVDRTEAVTKPGRASDFF